MGQWNDYVDESDGFLSRAFDNAFDNTVQEDKLEESLFQK